MKVNELEKEQKNRSNGIVRIHDSLVKCPVLPVKDDLVYFSVGLNQGSMNPHRIEAGRACHNFIPRRHTTDFA